ncbi:MAG: helix-turn-helix domain-containing protein [Rhodothalassiaceae bacterium]
MPAMRQQAIKQTSEPARELRRRLGRWLKQRREQQGLTQADLAARLGLQYYSFVSQVENGLGRIPQDLYAPWAVALDVTDRAFAQIVLAHLEPGLFELLTGEAPPAADAPLPPPDQLAQRGW